jgi:WD40 repeat protein
MGLCSSSATVPGGRPTAYNEGSHAAVTVLRRLSVKHSILQQGHTEGLLDVCAGSTRSPNQFFSCGEDKRILLHDYATGQILDSWDDAHSSAVNRLAFIQRRGMVASVSRDKTVRLWTPGVKTPSGVLVGHELTVSAVSATSDGLRLATGSRDTTVRLWDLDTQKALYRGHRPQNLVTCLKWYGPGSDSQNIIIQGAEDLRVRIWDTRVGVKEVQVLEGYVYFPLALDVSPCGRYILTSSKGFNGVGGEARLWDLRGGIATSGVLAPEDFSRSNACLVRQYNGHVQDASACCFVPTPIAVDGELKTTFLTASKDGTIRLWDQATGAVLYEHVDSNYGAFTSISMLPDYDPSVITPGTTSTNPGSLRRTASARQTSKPSAVFTTSTYNGDIFVYGIMKDGSFSCLARTPITDSEAPAPTTTASGVIV